MSKTLATKTYIIPTVMGNLVVRQELVADYDIEDVVRNKAESQAQAIKLLNQGKITRNLTNVSQETLPTMFKRNEEELEDG